MKNEFKKAIKFFRREGKSERTIENVIADTKRFRNWLKKPINQACKQDIEDYMSFLTNDYRTAQNRLIRVSTRARILASLKTFFKYLLTENEILVNPVNKVKSPKVHKSKSKPQIDYETVRKLIDLPCLTPLDIRNKTIIHVLASSGIRVTELANLKVDDIDLEKKELMVRKGKGKKDSVTFITSECASNLNEYLKSARTVLNQHNSEYLFLSYRGRKMEKVSISDAVNKKAKQLKVKINPHMFRSFLCTFLIENGLNLKTVSEIVSHEKISTTARYAQIDENKLHQIYRECHPRCSK